MNFSDLMKNLPGFQNMFQKMRENMKDIKATGEAVGGMVRVTVNGANEIIKIEIDDDLIKPEEKATLQKLIAGAANVALKRVQEKTQENLMNMAPGFNPGAFNKGSEKS